MHPETKKAVSSSKRKNTVNLENVQDLLAPCPLNTGILQDALVPCPVGMMQGIQPTLSNISGSTAGSQPRAFTAYERFENDDGSVKSDHSLGSQDTFSTYGDKNCNVWGDTKRIPFGGINWQMTWPEGLVKSRAFKRVSITLILINCIICAVATADFVTEDEQVSYFFDLAKDIFVYIMTIELFLQFLHHGLSLFAAGWLVFDFIIVASAWAVPNLLVVRTFRVVRTLRLASWVKDLKQLVLALLLVIPKMFAIFFLLFILFVIFSILFTDLFKHTYADGITDADYFGRLDTTLFTLFQIMTLDGWAEICTQIMTVHEWAWAPFIGFVVVSSFFFLNLVIAVVCEAVTSVHRDTVVKYIQDDISAATSVRDALKVEDRLDELAGSVQLMMQAQITVLETLQLQQAQLGQQMNSMQSSPELEITEQEARLQMQKDGLQQDLDDSVFGTAAQAAGNSAKQRTASTNQSAGTDKSVPLNPLPTQRDGGLLEEYMSAMKISARRQPKPTPYRPAFKSDAGLSTTSFWQQLGLTHDQAAKVMEVLYPQPDVPPMVQHQPEEEVTPPRSTAAQLFAQRQETQPVTPSQLRSPYGTPTRDSHLG